jgi:hypothetical protein
MGFGVAVDKSPFASELCKVHRVFNTTQYFNTVLIPYYTVPYRTEAPGAQVAAMHRSHD